jgi:HK97 family phage major capsid protein
MSVPTFTQEDIASLHTTLKDLRTTFERTVGEQDSQRTRISDTLEKLEKMNGTISSLETKFNAAIKAEDVRKELETKFETNLQAIRSDFSKTVEEQAALIKSLSERREGNGGTKQKSNHSRAFEYALRRKMGAPNIVADAASFEAQFGEGIVKTLTNASDLAGGYLAPVDFMDVLINQNIVEYSELRPLFSQYTTSGNSVFVPTRQRGGTTAHWVGEHDVRQIVESLGIGVVEIRTAEMAAVIALTNESMENPLFDVEGKARLAVAEEMGLLESLEFISGPGNGRPEGLLVNPAAKTISTGSETSVTADALMLATSTLKQFYNTGASWILNRLSLHEIRTMKYGNGMYVWQAAFNEGKPGNILGFPYTVAENMPKMAKDAFPIMFGNFKRAYTVVDRSAISFFIDPYSQSLSGVTQIIARRRIGGKVLVPEAYLRMQCN